MRSFEAAWVDVERISRGAAASSTSLAPRVRMFSPPAGGGVSPALTSILDLGESRRPVERIAFPESIFQEEEQYSPMFVRLRLMICIVLR